MFLTQWFSRIHVLIVGCVLLLPTVPAGAQTTCETPKIEGRDMIWASFVTVEEINPQGLGIIIGHGYGDGSSGSEGFGDLRNRTFTVASGTWPIDSISVGALAAVDGQLAFSLFGSTMVGTDLSATEISALQLHVCDQTFAFSDAATSDADHAYKWSASGLDWSGVSYRNVRISQPERFPQTVAQPPVVAPPLGPEGAELVSNVGSVNRFTTTPAGAGFAQRFTTGSHPDGYKLTRVRYRLRNSQTGKRFSSWIRQGNTVITRISENHGRSELALLTPQVETILSANTTYRFNVWTPTGIQSASTNSGAETGQAGWSIANTYETGGIFSYVQNPGRPSVRCAGEFAGEYFRQRYRADVR